MRTAVVGFTVLLTKSTERTFWVGIRFVGFQLGRDQIPLVTGAAKGIGAGIAKAMARPYASWTRRELLGSMRTFLGGALTWRLLRTFHARVWARL
jgi:hypothetical protein